MTKNKLQKMKRNILLSIIFLVGLNVMADGGNGHFHKSFRHQPVAVDNIEQQFSQWFTLPEGTEWREVSRSTDNIGMTRIEYRQYLSGIEVEHSQILLHVKDGRVLTANGAVMEKKLMPANAERFNRAPSYYSPEAVEGKLLLVDTPNGYRYATKKLSVKGEWEYRDIETGEVLKRVPATWHFTDDDGTTATVAGKGIFCGDVNMTVTKLSDGSYTLYDATRNVYTINAAYIKSLQELAENNMLQEYFPEELIPEETTYDNLRYMKNDLGNEKIDLTKYLLSAGTLKNADGQFFTYHLTGMTIERMLAADETQTVYDLMPSENKPSALRIKIRYAETDGSLFDMMTYLNGASTTISFADIAESYRLLPREGVTVIFCAGKPKGTYNPDDPESNVDNIIREYTMHFIPDESGTTVIDREDLKVTFTYEKTGDPAVDIHYNIGRALDYYKEVHGRNGYDGNNAPVYNIVYQPTTDDIMTLMPPQTNEMLAIEGKPNDDISDPREMPLYIFEMSNFNAGVINTYNPYFVAFGLGGKIWSQDTYMRPVLDRAITYHEFTHLVTATSAGLEYRNESGAINEAFSDVMAISMMKSPVYGNGSESPWIVGENLFTNSKYPCVRSLKDPKQGMRPSPDTYEGEHWIDWKNDTGDHGGVHTNSGVMNKFYYLLCDGGSGTNDKDYSYEVTGIGVEKAEKIAFRTLVQYATKTSDYSDIYNCFVEAATDLYGEAEIAAVKNAWAAVNVKPSEDIPDGIIAPAISASPQNSAIYDLQGRRVMTPTKGIYIVDGKRVVVK